MSTFDEDLESENTPIRRERWAFDEEDYRFYDTNCKQGGKHRSLWSNIGWLRSDQVSLSSSIRSKC